jgi:hypothetical protein
MNINELYSTKEEVISELKRRWADKDLDKKIENFLNKNIPAPFLSGPRAVLPRNLITPDNEFDTFYKKAIELELKPIGFEYLNDIFITTSHGKACLAKMIFFDGIKDNKIKTHNVRSIDLSGINEGKKFNDIKTLWNEDFVSFHHRILKNKYNIEVFDASSWLQTMGGKPQKYYVPYLLLLATKNVLFENLETGREEKFFNEIFLPAFEFIKKEFGLKPLIIPIAPADDMENIFWWSYPKDIENMIK